MTEVPHKGVKTPYWIAFLAFLVVAGFCFPIYGIPIATTKITIWRLGLPALALAGFIQMWGGSTFSKAGVSVLLSCGLFVIVRALSLFEAENPTIGLTQITWFLEAWIFVWSCMVFARRYHDFIGWLYRIIMAVGSLSVGTICVQYLASLGGILITLPLSTSRYGISPEMLNLLWTYPLYGGGRIIGAFWEPNMSGTLCTMMTIMYVERVLRETRVWAIIGWCALLMVAIVGVIGTGSRQSLITLFIIVPFFADRIIGKVLIKRLLLWSLVVAIVLGGIGLYASLSRVDRMTTFGEQQEDIFGRILQGEAVGDQTTGRKDWMAELVQKIDARTVAVGIGEGQTLGGAHNVFLATLVETGVPGLLSLLALLASMIWCATGSPVLWVTGTRLRALGLAFLLAWLIFTVLNWAQLNQGVCYSFIALAMAGGNTRFHARGAMQPDRGGRWQAVSNRGRRLGLHGVRKESP